MAKEKHHAMHAHHHAVKAKHHHAMAAMHTKMAQHHEKMEEHFAGANQQEEEEQGEPTVHAGYRGGE